MSFGTSSKALPPPPQKPLGVDSSRASTNEQARPIPYLAGKNRIGLTWITDPFNIRADAVTSSAGKGQSTTTGYNYYASLAGLLCYGPLDGIHEIYFNSDKVWSGDLTRSGHDHSDITVDNYGTIRLYWGTETQTEDAHMALTGFTHPPYKFQAYMVFEQIFFGFNQTNAPNVEVVVSRYPAPDWMTATAQIGNDANPVGIIGEWLQSKIFGLGLNTTLLDTSTLNAIGSQLYTEGFGLSPLVTDQSAARELIVKLCEYFGGYPLRTATGKFSLGLIRNPGDVSLLPSLSEADLTEEPDIEPDGWQAVKNKTWVKFTNATLGYQEDSLPYRDAGSFQVVGNNTPQNVDRPWITSPSLAQKVVAALGRANGLPAVTGTLTVKKASAASLNASSAFRLSYSDYEITDIVLRVQTKRQPNPGDQTVELDVAVDRSYLNDTFFVPADDVPGTPIQPTLEAFSHFKLWEIPKPWAESGEGVILGVLAARPNYFTTNWQLWQLASYRPPWSRTVPVATFFSVLATNQFAQHGVLAADYSHDTPLMDRAVGFQVTLDGADRTLESLTLDEAFKNTLVAIIDDEILSIFEVSLIATNPTAKTATYQVYAIRGRFDSRRQDHSTGAEVWIFTLVSPAYVGANRFGGVIGYPESLTFKLQPSIQSGALDLASITEIDYSTNGRKFRPYPPANLCINGDHCHPVYSSGQNLVLTWSLVVDGDIDFWTLVQGGAGNQQNRTFLARFYTTAGVLKAYAISSAGSPASLTLTNTDLQAAFGGEPDILVRLWSLPFTNSLTQAENSAYLSLFYEELIVRKI